MSHILDIGNEPILEGIRINTDFLKIVENLTATTELNFFMGSREECQKECETRYELKIIEYRMSC